MFIFSRNYKVYNIEDLSPKIELPFSSRIESWDKVRFEIDQTKTPIEESDLEILEFMAEIMDTVSVEFYQRLCEASVEEIKKIVIKYKIPYIIEKGVVKIVPINLEINKQE